MKKRFYLGLIILAVLLLALGGLVVRSSAALFRMGLGFGVTPSSTEGGVAADNVRAA